MNHEPLTVYLGEIVGVFRNNSMLTYTFIDQ